MDWLTLGAMGRFGAVSDSARRRILLKLSLLRRIGTALMMVTMILIKGLVHKQELLHAPRLLVPTPIILLLLECLLSNINNFLCLLRE